MALLPALLDMVDEIYSNLDNPEKTVGDIPLLFVPHGRRFGRGCPGRKEHGPHHHGPHGHKHGGSDEEAHCSKDNKEEGRECPRKKEHGHHRGHGPHKHGHKHSDSEEGGHSSPERRGHCGRKEKHCRFAEQRRAFCPYKGFASCPRFGGRGGCPCKKTTSDDFKVTFDVKSFNPEDVSVKVKGREIVVDGKHEERADEHGFVSRQFTRRYVVPDEYDIETVAPYLDSDGKMTIVANKPKPAVDESVERIIPIERVASVQEEVTDAMKNIELMDEDTSDSKKGE